MNAEFGAALKVGDEVAVVSEYGTVTRIQKVTRTTKSQFHAGGHTFWRKNGDVVGGGKFTRTSCHEPLPHFRAEAERYAVRTFLRESPWAKLSDEGRREVARFIKDKLHEEAEAAVARNEKA